MRAWVLLVVLAGCEDKSRSDSVPGLEWREESIQLQPDATSPRFKMLVPKHWEHDRALENGHRPVNGAGEEDEEFESKTFWIDPEMHDGQIQLVISCPDECGAKVEERIFAQFTD